MPPVSTVRYWIESHGLAFFIAVNTPDSTTPAEATQRTGRTMYLLAALALLGMLWLFFARTLEQRDNPNHGLSVAPGSANEITLQRNRQGHYVAPGTINGRPVVFLLDTGATVVSVPARLGASLALRPGVGAQVSTANGTVDVRTTTIDELGLGPFRLRDVRAHLNPGMDDDQVLLGMSALRQLEFTQRGDTLILRAQQP